MANEVHVWWNGSGQNQYRTKITGATTIAAGLAQALVDGPGTTVYIWADDPAAGRHTYVENVFIPLAGIFIVGIGYPVISGGRAGRTIEFKAGQKEATTLDGLEITGGKLAGNGAGAYAKNSSVVITNCCVHDNTTDEGVGGGVCLEYTDEADYHPSVVFNNRIWKNHAVSGGGVALLGVSMPVAGNRSAPVVHVDWNLISGNEARGARDAAGQITTHYLYGGGIHVFQLPCGIDGNEIEHNLVHEARAVDGDASGGGVNVVNVNENSHGAEAAAVFNVLLLDLGMFIPQVTLSDNYIHDNHSAYKGGGVSARWGAVLDLTQVSHEGTQPHCFQGSDFLGTTKSTSFFVGASTLVFGSSCHRMPNAP